MKPIELRELYDQQLRRQLTTPDMVREELPNIVRHFNPDEKWGYIPYSCLDEHNADRVIAEQVEYFRQRGTGFEWKYYTHDAPPDLKDRLAKAGASIDEDEAIMVLDIEAAPVRLTGPQDIKVRKLQQVDELDILMPVAEAAHGHSMNNMTAFFRKTLASHPEYLSIHAAYEGDKPVAVGWSYLYQTIPWAGLYGGGTLASHRGRGYYTALVAARMQEARALDARFLVVDAGSMSKPILEKLGFVQITISNPCEFEFSTEEAGSGKD